MKNQKATKNRVLGFQTLHAKRRMRERFGMEITGQEYHGLVEDIKKGNAFILRKLSNTRVIFCLYFRRKDVFALYNFKTKRIVTFLTLDQIYKKRTPYS